MGNEYDRERSARYYKRNREKKLAYNKANQQQRNKTQNERLTKVRAYIAEYKLMHPCIRCGESNPIVLQFHHRDRVTKRSDISKMLNYALETVKEEIGKCDMLCANCHLIVEDLYRRNSQ